MNAKQRILVICLLVVRLLISDGGSGQWPGPIRDGRVYANTTQAAVHAPSGSAPVLFFTDLTSGSKTGGQDNLGAFITCQSSRHREQF